MSHFVLTALLANAKLHRSQSKQETDLEGGRRDGLHLYLSLQCISKYNEQVVRDSLWN